MGSPQKAALPDTVRFTDPFFRVHAEGLFRLSDSDRTPVFAVCLGEQEFVLPVDGIQRELKLAKDAPDGIMLDAIVRSLEFVKSIRIGDTFPTEVLTGKSSWEPSRANRAIARQRFEAALIKWSENRTDRIATVNDLRTFTENFVTREHVATALINLQNMVKQDGREERPVASLVEELIDEMAYIEDVRSQLAQVERINTVLEAIRKASGNAVAVSEIDAVIRLYRIAVRMFRAQVAAVDSSIGDIFAAVSAFDSYKVRIRRVRNDLYSRLKAWDEVAKAWNGLSADDLDVTAAMPMVGELYRFLAPRYAPTHEWLRTDEGAKKSAARRPRPRLAGGERQSAVA